MDPFKMIRDATGVDYEIHRGDSVSVHRGSKHREDHGSRNEYIGFSADTDVRPGDVLVCTVTENEYLVSRTAKDEFLGSVSIKAYFDSPHSGRASHVSFNIGTMTNSAIQHASPGATQSVTFTQQNRESAVEVIQTILAAVDALGLNAEQRQSINEDVQAIETQLKSAKPKAGVIRGYFQSILDTLASVGNTALTSAAGAAAVKAIETYLTGR